MALPGCFVYACREALGEVLWVPTCLNEPRAAALEKCVNCAGQPPTHVVWQDITPLQLEMSAFWVQVGGGCEFHQRTRRMGR